ncbi:MAG: hypothetical protein GWO30_04515, partial [Gammaproteobacteria bacterium]|nr:hypothetical protein [Gammaproteobacteria bacterium]NIQ10428.1 hypothetical protein [Gammaproteobacteria bacterium]NIR25473.1 hypothetical protein [Gammaproteobacteria bacterium]NIY19720.1 hypothetical protein [Gammaproteobacteria bacterium]
QKQTQAARQKSDEQLQRICLLLALVVSLVFIIVPKGVLTQTEYSLGDVVPRDIKAPHDLLIPDEDLTEQKRNEAQQAVVNLYDYDPTAGKAIAEQVSQILTSLQKANAQEIPVSQQIAELESSFGIKVDLKDFHALQQLAAKKDIHRTVSQITSQLYRTKISGNLKLFEADRPKGV